MSELIPLIQADELELVRKPLPAAWTLPPGAYTTPQVFEAEIDAIFSKEWICVGREDQIPNAGDYVCIDLFDQPIVITRDRDDAVNAFSRVCLHRAMPVADGSGNATRFVCPYHNWTYELDGRLRSAPMMNGAEGFDAKKCRLPELAVELWQGFIFVNRDNDADPLKPRLSGLEKLIENYEFNKMVVADTIEFDSPWNWKILVENFMEAYHHIGTHKTTFEPVYPARDSMVEDNDGARWVLLRMPGKGGFVENETMFPKLTESQQNELLAICVFPTLLFAASATGGAWYQLEPTAHNRMHLKIHALAAPEVADAMDDEARQTLMSTLRTIHEEDIEANQGPWIGLNAGLTSQGRLSPFEKSIWQLNQLWADSLGLD